VREDAGSVGEFERVESRLADRVGRERYREADVAVRDRRRRAAVEYAVAVRERVRVINHFGTDAESPGSSDEVRATADDEEWPRERVKASRGVRSRMVSKTTAGRARAPTSRQPSLVRRLQTPDLSHRRLPTKEFAEGYLVWRCLACGTVGRLDAAVPTCPDCGVATDVGYEIED
jgi:rubrerythrin